ncbi:DNA-binding protein [Serinibacter arcticus]|uniref:DNA-binding protein n=1 Tax=Serinibacter arcticus TaxID=1655435 RepID=A0A2U1ZZ99_9MICO|nr:OB-fold nucleic acid binding domain-containing protein [Serinibacter arcticus]PWD52318.1 DNA-binding protein [Serinibacter arcticus]
MGRTRLLASNEEIHASDQRAWVASYDVEAIADVVPRTRAHAAGVLRSVTYAPHGSTTALRAELFDGTGSLDLVWTGRRDVPGIVPGRRLLVTGMVARSEPWRARLAIHNPTYDLLPTGDPA